jgi:hypothetical protein
MIVRHLYTAQFKAGVTAHQAADWYEALTRLEIEGMRRFMGGPDLGLREGNADFALVADFENADAWRRYDEDEEHNQIRREIAAEIVDKGERCQIQAPDADRPAPVRNVTLIWYRPDAGDDAIEATIDATSRLRVTGMEALVAGRDLGLRAGNAHAAVVADFNDAEAYRRYDVDEEHNRIRRELLAPIVERIARVQFRVPT